MCGFRNTLTGYGLITRLLHGLLATLVIIMLIAGSLLESITDKALKGQLVGLHKSTGVLILGLGILFIIWSVLNKKPAYPSNMPIWERKFARSVHGLLYLFLLAMPLSGLVMSVAAGKTPTFYGLFTVTLPGVPLSKPLAGFAFDMHETLAWCLFGLICLHLLGALKHHFIDKNDILVRMYKQK